MSSSRKKMAVLSTCLIALWCYFTFFCKEDTSHIYDITGIKITRNFPIIDFKDSIGKIIRYDTLETIIYRYKSQELYQTYYSYTGISGVDSIPSINEYRCNFFVYNIGQLDGLFYDSANRIYSQLVPVDSMLKRQRMYKLEAQDLFDEMDTIHIRTLENKITGDNEDLFAYKGKKDSTMTGTIIFSFADKSKFKNIDYSFSKELDSLKNMKLYKITTVTDSRFIGPPINIYMDRAEAFHLLEKIAVKNPEEVMKYFDAERKFRSQ